MKTHHIAELRSAIEKLLPYGEAAQEALYKATLKYPGRDQTEYEDCRHAVSFAYEALAKTEKVPDIIGALRFCDMTLADLEASKRKGYIAEAKRLVRAALAGIGL
jgi:hypothetical protein